MIHNDGLDHRAGRFHRESSDSVMTAVPVVTPGLCSSTLRGLSLESVVEFAATSTMAGLAWGSDTHVSVGDVATAKRAGALTVDAGLRVAAYGSWFRLGADDEPCFGPVLDTARALGAPRIGVWAGDIGSAGSTGEQRRAVVESIRSAATRAADVDIELVIETRPGTLADRPPATERLLAEVGRSNVLTYWQPPIGVGDASALDGLDRLLPKVAAVHVFSWRPGNVRFPLSERAQLWRGVVDRLTAVGRNVDMFLEFVPNNDADALRRESVSLRDMLDASRERVRTPRRGR